ncbi:MAG: YybH family protein [Planctomycetota bacterium]
MIANARVEIAAAMQRYQVAARTTNPDRIAAMYTPNATLFEPGINPVHTRESIRAFIASFPGVRVDVATATPDVIEVYGTTAYLWGSYYEKLSFPGQPLSEQHGKFVAKWMQQPDGTWLIERLFRIPIPTPPSDVELKQ